MALSQELLKLDKSFVIITVAEILNFFPQTRRAWIWPCWSNLITVLESAYVCLCCLWCKYRADKQDTGVLLFESFSLLNLVVSQFLLITNQFAVDDLGLDKNIAALAKE